MFEPTYENLHRLSGIKSRILFCGGVSMHPNPRLYKYYWWVFTSKSHAEGAVFLSEENRLCYSDYLNEVEAIRKNGISSMIYNRKYYRLNNENPWDYEKLQKKGHARFAPAFENDTDPVTPSGHR